MWYQTLPDPVKSYIESLNTQIAKGGVDLNATPSAFSFPVTNAASTGTTTGKGTVKATSTSKADAAQVTGDISLSLAAVIGILGAVIAL